MRNNLIILCMLLSAFNAFSQQTIIQYLSGTDKDHTVQWDFMVNNGRKKDVWSSIPVPSCWEMQGFGTYSYYQDVRDANETGMYKFRFTVKPEFKNRKVVLVFEGSMTDTEVKLNGRPAGPKHIGGFYEFKYDVTDLVAFSGTNLLEVTVNKKSVVNSVNRAERQADFWLFGGIFRPVYLEIVPEHFIERTALDARANGDFSIQVFSNARSPQTIEAQVYDLKGKAIDKPFQLKVGDSVLHHHFSDIKTWNPEQPNLYNVVVSVKEGKKIIHTVKQRFGFRTVEMREQDGFYVNDKKVIFRGVCRHSQWPESGRTLSRSVHLMDIAAIKGMNMNAVRMSHYPPDKEFLDLCDSLGLFVLDELTGWQKAYDTVTAKRLVKELIVRDVNHPSIVIWDNGNEGGWNRGVDRDYALYDPQKRHVIHPWERFDGTNTKHYPDYKYVKNEVANAKEIFFPTEFMHGLFDGGHGAALEDFWNLLLGHRQFAGAFLWALHDEGVVRADWHDSIDVAGNSAPDGIVGPHREREGSYYTIKELWSPVYIETNNGVQNFSGKIPVQNRYIYTNLDKIKFEWKLVKFPLPADKTFAAGIVKKGLLKGPAVAPGDSGSLDIPLPSNTDADAFYLTAYDWQGDTVCTWSWPLVSPEKFVQAKPASSAAPAISAKDEGGSIASAISAKDEGGSITVINDGINYSFDKSTGYLQKVFNGNREISFMGGPALAGGETTLEDFKSYNDGNAHIIEPTYKGGNLKVKWTFVPGKLPALAYSYTTKDTADFMGITFKYPEDKITGIKYLGRGPYRVWKNRLKGQQLGVWQKAYNNTVTGENWIYPEFKGYYSQFYWMQLQTSEASFLIYTDQPKTYLQLLKPQRPKAAGNENTSPPFPDGNIGFMQAIPAIGTKFNRPEAMGPQSQKNFRNGAAPLTGTLYFDFR